MAQEKILVGSFGTEKILVGKMEFNASETPIGKISYNILPDKPSINNIVLVGNITLEDLGVASKDEVISLTDKVIFDCGDSMSE